MIVNDVKGTLDMTSEEQNNLYHLFFAGFRKGSDIISVTDIMGTFNDWTVGLQTADFSSLVRTTSWNLLRGRDGYGHFKAIFYLLLV